MRRVLMLLAFAAIVATRIEPQFLIFPFRDRAAFAHDAAQLADRNWSEYPRFLAGVRAQTRPGDSIAILVPGMRWDGGYSYAYYRASYLLAGREVLPLVTSDDRPHRENFAAAKYIAVWRAPVVPRGALVWSGSGGTLTRMR